MNPSRVDSVVDLAYGALIFGSVALMVLVGTQAGLAFGLDDQRRQRDGRGDRRTDRRETAGR